MIGSVPDGDRGVLASGNIEKGDVAVSVPDESVLMPENCSAVQVLPLCKVTLLSTVRLMNTV
jgi:hypothetical protein